MLCISRGEEEILEHLDNFQRQTEAIRRHLSLRRGAAGGGGSSGTGSSLDGGAGGLGGPSSSSLFSGLEPTLGRPAESAAASGGYSRGAAYPATTVAGAGGATPMQPLGRFPSGLVHESAGPMRAAALGPLFSSLPESPQLGAGRAALRGGSSSRQPAAASQGQQAGDGGATPPPPRRPVSPAIRHTLKSAAAAQKNQRASPAVSAPGSVGSQQQHPSQQQPPQEPRERQRDGSSAQRDAAGEGFGRSPGASALAGGGRGRLEDQTPASHPQAPARLASQPGVQWEEGDQGAQQQQQRSGRSHPAGWGAIGWGPGWPEQEGPVVVGSSLPSRPEPGSNAAFAGSAADLRRRLEQQLGEAASSAAAGTEAEEAAAAAVEFHGWDEDERVDPPLHGLLVSSGRARQRSGAAAPSRRWVAEGEASEGLDGGRQQRQVRAAACTELLTAS